MLPHAPRELLAPFHALRTLAQHPVPVLIVVLASVLLAQGALFVQLRMGLPADDMTEAMVRMAALIPVELYLMPRLLLRVDALELDRPENPESDWSSTFEARWTRMVAARLLLALATAMGIMLFVVPGILIFLCFGWTPHRVLLRGEDLSTAARGSLAMIRGALGRTLLVGLAIGATFFLVAGVASLLLTRQHPDPSLSLRLTHPLFWGVQALASLAGTWVSLAFLALFQGTEVHATPVASDREEG